MPILARLLCLMLTMWGGAAWAQTAIPGHGGPIRAVAADGTHIVSGSFDGTALVWPEGLVLRAHAGAVNAVALMADGAVVTGGADGRVMRLRYGSDPVELGRHDGPVAALATQGERVASAGWDGTARIWGPRGAMQVLSGHDGNVNGVAFAPDGAVVTAGYDGTLRRWAADGTAEVTRVGVPQNAVVVAPDGQIVAGGADGMLRLFGADGTTAALQIDTAPVTAVAIAPEGKLVAVVTLGGVAMLVDRTDARIVTVLLASEAPLWAVAFAGPEVVTGGAGRVLRRWDPASGRPLGPLGAVPVLERFGDSRGAQIFRACAACHSLGPDGGNRAGPSLHHLFGRRIASLPGYDYSPALRNLPIVWTPETVARLFTIGPQAATPGTKMPEQVITSAEDRAALVQFLEQATR
jgi:cytochrome c